MIRKRKKRFLIISLLLIFLFSSVAVTYAVFNTSGIFENEFKTSSYYVYIDEEFYNTWGTKKVCFVNSADATVPVLLRINYNELWSKNYDDNTLLVISNEVNGTNVVNKIWTSNFQNDFTLGSDGWYYYNKLLNIGEEVCVLESISLNEELISTSEDYDKYKSYDYQLDFNFEASQSDIEAARIWDNGVEIKDTGEVVWKLSEN